MLFKTMMKYNIVNKNLKNLIMQLYTHPIIHTTFRLAIMYPDIESYFGFHSGI